MEPGASLRRRDRTAVAGLLMGVASLVPLLGMLLGFVSVGLCAVARANAVSGVERRVAVAGLAVAGTALVWQVAFALLGVWACRG